MNKGTHMAFIFFCITIVVAIFVLLMMWENSMSLSLPANFHFV